MYILGGSEFLQYIYIYYYSFLQIHSVVVNLLPWFPVFASTDRIEDLNLVCCILPLAFFGIFEGCPHQDPSNIFKNSNHILLLFLKLYLLCMDEGKGR